MIEKLYRKIKRLLNVALCRDFYTSIDCKIDSTKYGSKYCGWNILSSEINHNSIVFSCGLGEDISFDVALIEEFGLTVHGFDPTPKSIDWVNSQLLSNKFVLHEIGIYSFDGVLEFHVPNKNEYVSHSAINNIYTSSNSISLPVKSVKSIVRDLGIGKIDIMKMDIEGAEYDVISDLIDCNITPRQLLVEFHHRFPEINILKTKKAIKKLREIGYKIYFISLNGEEYSFIYDPHNKY